MKNAALITGASSGIGKELAAVHAERGGDAVLVARREDKLNELKSELESTHAVRITVISKDLTRPEAPREVYDEIAKGGGGLTGAGGGAIVRAVLEPTCTSPK